MVLRHGFIGKYTLGSGGCLMLGAHTRMHVHVCPRTHTGIWRGQFPAFEDATGNSLGAPPAALDQVPRDFVIYGHLDEADNFVVRPF